MTQTTIRKLERNLAGHESMREARTSGATLELIAAYWTLAGALHPSNADGVGSTFSIESRICAAADAGYRGIGFDYADAKHMGQRHDGWGFSEVKSLLEEHGIVHVEIEVLMDWFDTGTCRAAAEQAARSLFNASQALGARHVKALGDVRGGSWSLAQMAHEFHRLCDLASHHGATVALETTPLSNLATPTEGLSLIEASGAKNAGLMLDSWHVGRAGFAYDRLKSIPVSRIAGVELSDANRDVCGSLLEDTMNHRQLCGDGALDIVDYVQAVMTLGYAGPFGVEIVSDAHRNRSLTDAAQISYRTARAQLGIDGWTHARHRVVG